MKNGYATLWHKEPNGTYKKILFDKILITKEEKEELKGVISTKNSNVKIRLFCEVPIDIQTGDRISEGIAFSQIPPENAYVISEIKQNFNCSKKLRHYKLLCL